MQLLETLLAVNGSVQNLYYHNRRLNESTQAHFERPPAFSLEAILKPPAAGEYRCRVLYDADSYAVDYTPYERHFLSRFHLHETDFSYPYKYAERSYFNETKALYPDVDEVIYLKEGLLTDTGIANIACWIDARWLTPKTPLLPGTRRAQLLDRNYLHPEDITLEMLKNADAIAMMNALTGFYRVQNPIIEGF